MILNQEQVKEIAKSEADSWIESAREEQTHLSLHYYGGKKELEEYLKKADGLESEEELQLRKRYAVSNTFITENLLRPTDFIWNARGGTKKINIRGKVDENEAAEKLENVRKDFSLMEYMKQKWFPCFVTDPNGLVFLEVSEDSTSSKLCQKSIHSIKNMKVDGYSPEFVCFEPHETIVYDESEINKPKKPQSNKKTTKKMWIVDDVKYYLVKVEDQDTVEILEERMHNFACVPAVINSPIYNQKKCFHVSPIDKQIELLDKYVRNGSVKEIYIAKHGFPVFWMYAPKCQSCKGSGVIDADTCRSCGGTGQSVKKDVSNALILKTPRDSESPIIAPNVAGYVSPSIETWQEQRAEQDWTWSLLFYSHWGTMETQTSKGGEKETATGRFIDSQAVTNKLNQYADIFEDTVNKLASLVMKFHYTASFQSSHITVGRRFIVERSDDLWKKYVESKVKGAPDVTLDLLLDQYYASEYQRDADSYLYYCKLMKIEPYVHKSISQVLELPVDDEVKKMKLYFCDWVNETMMMKVLEYDISKLKKDLQKFVLNKQLNNERTSEQS